MEIAIETVVGMRCCDDVMRRIGDGGSLVYVQK